MDINWIFLAVVLFASSLFQIIHHITSSLLQIKLTFASSLLQIQLIGDQYLIFDCYESTTQDISKTHGMERGK